MILPRLIPILLLSNDRLVKTVRFRGETYIGDPINAIKIFNEKEVDELVLLDISATTHNVDPQYDRLAQIATECFSPFCYGGGVRSMGALQSLFKLGAEKVSLNTVAYENPAFVELAVSRYGGQSIVGSMDVKKSFLGKSEVWIRGGTKNTHISPLLYAKRLEALGVGELFINSIDCDGTRLGYDWDLVKTIANAVSVPVVAIGGAGSLEDMVRVIKVCNASAAGAGSLFSFQGKHRAVLITYPDRKTIETAFTNG